MRTVLPPSTAEITAARDVVAAHLAPTPAVFAPALGPNVFCKLETFQPTGSFKVRGALAAVARALATRPDARFITASAGNHGLGVAFAAAAYRASATIVVPETASSAKREALSRLPVTVEAVGSSYDEAERFALDRAEHGFVYVSPYNDAYTIAGQTTVATELFDQVPDVRTIVVPVGGGGLVSGVALAARGRDDVDVIGVEAAASPAMQVAVEQRHATPIDVRPTLADGLAGNLEPGSVTVAIASDFVHGFVAVSEDEIADAMRFAASAFGWIIEGAAAVGIAALRSGRIANNDGNTAVLITGRNVSLATYASVLAGEC